KNEEVAFQIYKYIENQIEKNIDNELDNDINKYCELEFGDFLNVLIIKEGYKDLNELAERSGISVNILRKYMSKNEKPNPEILRELSNVLTSITYIELMSKAGFDVIEDVISQQVKENIGKEYYEIAVSKET